MSARAARRGNRPRQSILSALTAVIPLTLGLILYTFLLYWRTAAPSVLTGDAGEFQFAAWGFWLAHPTGYPLYLILGGLWQHLLPFGDPAFRLNLFSAFWSSLAVGLAFLASWRITHSRAASGIAALTFAVSPLFWSQATRAEVYALNTFFVALLTLLGLLWREKPQRTYAIAFALTFGLSLTHHRTTILLIPAFAALLADRLLTYRFDRAFARRALFYIALAAVPLLLYLYIPLRAGATPYATLHLDPAAPIVIFENSPRGWLNVLLGSGFSNELAANASTFDAISSFPARWAAELNPFAILGALFGFGALLWRRQLALAAFLLFGILSYLVFNSIYQIGDIADYYTPVYFFSCLALAEGLAVLLSLLRAHAFTRSTTLPAIALLALFALLPLQNFFNNFFAQDRSQYHTVRNQWEAILGSDLPDHAILISNDRDEMTPLYYMQLVEHQRPGWVGIFPKIAEGPRYDNVVSLVARVAASGREIFALKPIPALTLRYPVTPLDNGLARVDAVTPGTPEFSSDAVLGDAIRVRGYTVEDGDLYAGERLTLALQYEVLKQLTRDYTTSVQLFDREGNKVAQANDHIPGEGEYPSSAWRVGEIVQDRFIMELDPNLQTGVYDLMLQFYDPSGGEPLNDLTKIGTLEIRQ